MYLGAYPVEREYKVLGVETFFLPLFLKEEEGGVIICFSLDTVFLIVSLKEKIQTLLHYREYWMHQPAG